MKHSDFLVTIWDYEVRSVLDSDPSSDPDLSLSVSRAYIHGQ